MNVLEWITERMKYANPTVDVGTRSFGKSEEKKVEDRANWYYSMYLKAYHNQYVIGTPLNLVGFLSLPYEFAAVLDFMPGSLVKVDGKYYLLKEWRMNGNRVIAMCVGSNGVESEYGPDDGICISDLPEEVRDIFRREMAEKCPLANGKWCSE